MSLRPVVETRITYMCSEAHTLIIKCKKKGANVRKWLDKYNIIATDL